MINDFFVIEGFVGFFGLWMNVSYFIIGDNHPESIISE